MCLFSNTVKSIGHRWLTQATATLGVGGGHLCHEDNLPFFVDETPLSLHNFVRWGC